MSTNSDNPCRLLVVLPNWVGDVVLATPTLAALRSQFPETRIAYLLRRYVSEVVEGGGWHDELVFWPSRDRMVEEATLLRLTARLRAGRFDAALLLPNSFRSALVAWLARIPRRVGYAREARTWLLTDRIEPLRRDGQFVPASVLPYYARLAEHIGCHVRDRRLRLGISPEQEQAGAELMRHYGLDRESHYAVINPGARFGAAKCWPPERFAEVGERLWSERQMRPVLVGSASEAPLMHDIARRVTCPVVCCDHPGTTLGTLKPLMRGATLLVCNDTGPRHYGLAFGVPTVTIFGPTHQEWTDTGSRDEIKLQVPVECGPCQLPRCPLDHRCMTGVTTDMVMQAVAALLDRPSVDRIRSDGAVA